MSCYTQYTNEDIHTIPYKRKHINNVQVIILTHQRY